MHAKAIRVRFYNEARQSKSGRAFKSFNSEDENLVFMRLGEENKNEEEKMK